MDTAAASVEVCESCLFSLTCEVQEYKSQGPLEREEGGGDLFESVDLEEDLSNG